MKKEKHTLLMSELKYRNESSRDVSNSSIAAKCGGVFFFQDKTKLLFSAKDAYLDY